MTPGLLRCTRNKDNLHRKHKKDPKNETLQKTFTRYRNFCTNLLRKVKQTYEQAELEKAKRNPKATWAIIKSISHSKSKSPPPLELLNLCTERQSSLNAVNNYFATIGKDLATKIKLNKNDATTQASTFFEKNQPNSFGLTEVDPFEINSLISGLRSDCAVGHDGISSQVLKSVRHKIVPILTHICNLCFNNGTFPTCLKKAIVHPIHKSGDRDSVNNYRPISVLNTLSKVLEKAINNRLISFLEANEIISPSQYGFRKGKSTEDAVINLTSTVSKTLDCKQKCMGIFLDLSKAFDTVSVPLLLNKLERIGVRGLTLNIFRDYLSDRTQSVKIGDFLSDECPVTYGVPQGSILGPTLFTIYINELCNMALPHCKIITYADDTALLVQGKNWTETCQRAESALSTVMSWLSHNLLTLNLDKTKCLPFSLQPYNLDLSKLTLKAHTCCQNLQDCPCLKIEIVQKIKYLGVILDTALSWNAQLINLTNRCRKLIYIFKTLRNALNIQTLTTVYYALAQSILTYCISAWGGACTTHMLPLERAQRAVLKVMTRKHFRYPTSRLYADTKVLTVRQLFVLNCTLRKHKTLSYDADMMINKRRKDLVCQIPLHKTSSAAKHFPVISSRLYNTINKNLNIYPLLMYLAKHKIKEWLLSLSYKDTENLLSVLI